MKAMKWLSMICNTVIIYSMYSTITFPLEIKFENRSDTKHDKSGERSLKRRQEYSQKCQKVSKK